MDTQQIQQFKDRRHPKIADKLDIWKLISDSYVGGQKYTQGQNLFKYPRENSIEYAARKKRSVFFNHVQPLVDTLVGFLFMNAPERTVPDGMEYLVDQASKQKSINSFMQTVAIHAMQYTVGILVDSPSFDLDAAPTMADRGGMNPYCVLYQPWMIRDYSLDQEYSLDWILLDNSYVDNSDPFRPPVKRTVYRMWTKVTYQDFEFFENENKDIQMKAHDEYEHGLGIVPFVFVNFRDLDDDLVCETQFEDIALIDRQVYNTMSYFDEMLAAGSFKTLFFPCENRKDIPDEILDNGLGGLSVVPYQANLSQKPFFAGAELDDIESFIKAIDLYLREIFRKVGMSEDTDKNYVQSGKAKLIEFRKAESFLRIAAEQLENTERSLFEIAGAWERRASGNAVSKYYKQFKQEDVDIELQRLHDAYSLPYKDVQKLAVEEMIRKYFPDVDDVRLAQVIKTVLAEIDNKPVVNDEGGTVPNVDEIVDAIKSSQDKNSEVVND